MSGGPPPPVPAFFPRTASASVSYPSGTMPAGLLAAAASSPTNAGAKYGTVNFKNGIPPEVPKMAVQADDSWIKAMAAKKEAREAARLAGGKAPPVPPVPTSVSSPTAASAAASSASSSAPALPPPALPAALPSPAPAVPAVPVPAAASNDDAQRLIDEASAATESARLAKADDDRRAKEAKDAENERLRLQDEIDRKMDASLTDAASVAAELHATAETAATASRNQSPSNAEQKRIADELKLADEIRNGEAQLASLAAAAADHKLRSEQRDRDDADRAEKHAAAELLAQTEEANRAAAAADAAIVASIAAAAAIETARIAKVESDRADAEFFNQQRPSRTASTITMQARELANKNAAAMRAQEEEAARQATIKRDRLQLIETARAHKAELDRVAKIESDRLAVIENARLAVIEEARKQQAEADRLQLVEIARVAEAAKAVAEAERQLRIEAQHRAREEEAQLAMIEAGKIAAEEIRLAEIEELAKQAAYRENRRQTIIAEKIVQFQEDEAVKTAVAQHDVDLTIYFPAPLHPVVRRLMIGVPVSILTHGAQFTTSIKVVSLNLSRPDASIPAEPHNTRTGFAIDVSEWSPLTGVNTILRSFALENFHVVRGSEAFEPADMRERFSGDFHDRRTFAIVDNNKEREQLDIIGSRTRTRQAEAEKNDVEEVLKFLLVTPEQ